MRIVGIHGIGQTLKTAFDLQPEWLHALNGGITEAGGTALVENEFGMVSYGSVYRRANTRSANPVVDPDSLDEFEQKILEAIWRESARLADMTRKGVDTPDVDESPFVQGPEADTRARVPAFVQRALNQLAKSRFGKRVGQNVLLFGLRQVKQYLLDNEIKAAVLQRVDQVVTRETQVIIGHSLGSVVAYEALCQKKPDWNVHTLITLGSPLGIPSVVFEALTPKPTNQRGVKPPVTRWVNVADEGDIVALVKKLAPLFDGVEDFPVYNGWKSHSSTNYLTNCAVGAAIRTALS